MGTPLEWVIIVGTLSAALLVFVGALVWPKRDRATPAGKSRRRIANAALVSSDVVIALTVALLLWVAIQLDDYQF